MYSWGEKSNERMQGVNPLLIDCVTRALSKSRHDMTIGNHGGVRTAEEQKKLYDKGYSKCDGFEKKSYHQSGNAIDVIPVGANPYENTRHLNHFAQKMVESWQEMIYQGTAKGLLVWGGTWGKDGWDKPHWQIRGL